MLQGLEAERRAIRGEGDDLTVEHDRFVEAPAPVGERGGDVGKLAGLLVAVPRPEAAGGGRAGGHLDNGADAVVFGLEAQAGADERRLGVTADGQHRPQVRGDEGQRAHIA